ncbi:MAG TPA: hypothetical protein PKO25_05690 [Spirochaetota bacterium]|jgi:hypothetical protein|nr:hypothetical protein [Spirochaetota bacterium]OPZ37119.1 MAG: hypothetical protein BWY96_01848 [Spirochaetes bacterium ADurb.BinA120]HNU91345.1 hypothetical protein [Spirochaetota bacterium]HPI13705.1 hypothetical protein [Spirochaetota bacterium]HPV97802.1 hypothetical protein [Spirochaetota bacterium]
MGKREIIYDEVVSASTYSVAEAERICTSMRESIKSTTSSQKKDFLRRIGIIDINDKLTKEYGG